MSAALFPRFRVLWMPLDHPWQPPSREAKHCCADMAAALDHTCEQHADPFDCPDTLLVFHEIFGEYGLPIRDGGTSYLVVKHCPFCGGRLADSARDAWFDAVEVVGLADAAFDQLPPRLRSSAWRSTNRG